MTATPSLGGSVHHGIHTVDTGFHRPNFDAAYLMVEGGRAAFIDTGTTHSVPRLLAALASAGLKPEDADWVIVTHVHLDHAGGAGALMQALPNARLLVHPRGERHMVDPSALIAGASEVYGADEVARAYGTIAPIPKERVVVSHDGMAVQLAGRTLTLLDTPGHAKHHHCIWDERSKSFFTGDTFGLSYREFDTAQGPWLLPTTTPVHFDPPALKASVQRLLSYRPESMYLTHYGRVQGVAALGATLLEQIDELVQLALPMRDAADRHAGLKQALSGTYLKRVRAHGCTLPDTEVLHLLENDIELNAQGIGVWLAGDKR
ncbi:MBL fold metallo-hydrolase [Piscinibacter gummiphilus]|uniref:MBL fold metallo-hydrolase n=1 Tax=Piscinibacter gummiphilus TaxID=946333 RepID=A0ABZ0CVQ1_9BURK|nr:MBL fold metallo-hydrolase [Piscinibacter gummiphilus]WOB07050.1 MBL fold metallo-hydrolase [Piscinibacter gummiphilus]